MSNVLHVRLSVTLWAAFLLLTCLDPSLMLTGNFWLMIAYDG